MSIRVLTISMLVLVGLAIPADATIVYCNSGCVSNTGMTYASFQTAASAFNYNFTSPINFVSGGLNGSGVYTDSGAGTGGTATVLTGYNGTSTEALVISGTALAQQGNSVQGNGKSIGITLPANTYAFAMFVSTTANFASPYVELVSSPSDFNTNGNFTMSISNSSDSEFFGIISDTPIASIFIGDLLFNQSPLQIQSFELGQQQQAPDVPEVSTLGMIGTGLIALRMLRRRRDTSPPSA